MKLENLQDLNFLFALFNNAIKENDIQEIRRCLSRVKSCEEFFLKNYDQRKKEGVYYTNVEISDFIVSETLLLLLNKKLKIENEDPPFLEKIQDINKLNSNNTEKIFQFLLNLKVWDPACGSGIFLLSYANLLFNTLKKINEKIDESNVKSNILKNLHGFDINKFAIKLTILKLFAWFFNDVDLKNSEVLSFLKSNIEHKNSLIISNSTRISYDIIVSNPPFGNILNKSDKAILKQENVFYNDIYCAFLLKMLNWSNGIIGFLVPKSFLLRQNYLEFRNKFLSEANLLKIFDLGPNFFKSATNEVQIVFYEKKQHLNRDLQVYNFPSEEMIIFHNQNVDSLKICLNSNCPLCDKSKKFYAYTFKNNCPYCGSETINLNRIRIKLSAEIYQLIEKIEKNGNLNYLNVKKFPKMVRGEEYKSLKEIKKLIKSNVEGNCFFIGAKENFKYYHLSKNKSFNIEGISAQQLKGDTYDYYTRPKLLIKHNNIIPEAIYTEENTCFTSSIYSLLHEDKNELKYLCAVLNSILIQFYCIYGINNQKGTTINLNQYMIRHIPIVKPKEPLKLEISKSVDLIIDCLNKSKGTWNKTAIELLKTIDEEIFNLYSIAENERKFILNLIKNQICHFKIIYHKL